MTATIYKTERGEYAVKWQRASMAAPAFWYFGTLAEALQAARGLFPIRRDARTAQGVAR